MRIGFCSEPGTLFRQYQRYLQVFHDSCITNPTVTLLLAFKQGCSKVKIFSTCLEGAFQLEKDVLHGGEYGYREQEPESAPPLYQQADGAVRSIGRFSGKNEKPIVVDIEVIRII